MKRPRVRGGCDVKDIDYVDTYNVYMWRMIDEGCRYKILTPPLFIYNAHQPSEFCHVLHSCCFVWLHADRVPTSFTIGVMYFCELELWVSLSLFVLCQNLITGKSLSVTQNVVLYKPNLRHETMEKKKLLNRTNSF